MVAMMQVLSEDQVDPVERVDARERVDVRGRIDAQPDDDPVDEPEAYIPDELDLLEPDFTDLDSTEHGAWVDAAPFRAHVRRLIADHRLTWRTVAMLAEVPTPAIGRLVCGRGRRPVSRLHPLIAERLFHLTDESIRVAAIQHASTTRSRELLGRLLDHGWSIRLLADRAGLSTSELIAITSGECDRCSQLTEAVIKAVAQALWTVPGPDPAPACAALAAAA